MLLKNKMVSIRSAIYILSAIVFTCFQSCTKVIDINFKSAPKKYVIEGVITNNPGECKVLISQTKDFYQNNFFQGVSGAKVVIKDNAGNVDTLTESSQGVFAKPSLVGVPNRLYTLLIQIGNESFTAESVMPLQIALDSIFFTNDIIFNSSAITSNIDFNDPLGKGNYYNFIQWVNGKKTPELYPLNDELGDGNTQTVKLYMVDAEDDEKIKSGDTIKVEMQCIDASVYKYWYSAQQSATGEVTGGSVPANPLSNIKGNALGYFSAHAVQRKTRIVH